MHPHPLILKEQLATSTQPPPDSDDLPRFSDVLTAVKNLEGVTHVTPVVTSKTIN